MISLYCEMVLAVALAAAFVVLVVKKWGWDEWMQIDLPLLRTSHGVLMLPDWKDSNGARMEHREAGRIHKRMFYEIDDIEEANDE